MRQIYIACVLSIVDYGSVFWWKGQEYVVCTLQKLQNLAMRKILGVFKTSPILPMEVESCLLPPRVRLRATMSKFAFRMLKLAPNHPVNLEMQEKDFILPKQTQLSRTKSIIDDISCSTKIEKIVPLAFPPWISNPQYTVHINKETKLNMAENHEKKCSNTDWERTTHIYTDDSAHNESGGVGIRIAATNSSGQHIYQSKSNIGDRILVYNGELEALTQALEYASLRAQPGHQFEIFSDNQEALHRLASLSDYPGQSCQIRAVKASNIISDQFSTVSLHWIPAHLGIKGNEIVDQLAKVGSKLAPINNEMSFAMIGAQIKSEIRDCWLESL